MQIVIHTPKGVLEEIHGITYLKSIFVKFSNVFKGDLGKKHSTLIYEAFIRAETQRALFKMIHRHTHL